MTGLRVPSNCWRWPEAAFSAQPATLNRLWFMPIRLDKAQSWDAIGSWVDAAAADSSIRFGIYEDADGYPGALVIEAGTVSSASTGLCSVTISPAVDLPAGVVWVAAVAQGGTPTTKVGANGSPAGLGMVGHSGPAGHGGTAFRTGYYTSDVTGALPAEAPADLTWARWPIHTALRAA